MKSFTSPRVVKSCAVEVAAPRVLDCQANAFQRLASHLTVVKIDMETNSPGAEPGYWDQYGVPGDESQPEDEFLSRYSEQERLAIGEAKARAEEIIAQAQAEAHEIRRQAELEAEKLRVQARAEEESYRRQLEAAIRAEVLPQARQEGYEEGVRTGREETAALRAEAHTLFKLAQTALAQEYAKAEEDLLHLAIQIAECLVRAELKVEPVQLLAIVKTLSLLPQERQGWRLHLSAQDAAWIETLGPDALPCPWIEDESLDRGDCWLECQEGIFDARIIPQLERLEEILQEELKRGAVAEVGRDHAEYGNDSFPGSGR